MTKRLRKNCRRSAAPGMTLVEIMIVVIIMALIATGVAYAVVPMLTQARIHQTERDVRVIHQAVGLYMIRNSDECPGSVDELSLSSSARRTDAWGSTFSIECDSSDEPAVSSPGPDRQPGTSDDISSIQPRTESG